MSRADPLAGSAVGRGLRITAFVVAVVAWATALAQALGGPTFYPSWFLVGSFGLVGLVLAVCAVQCFTPSGPLTGMRLYVALALVLRWVELIVVDQPPDEASYAPLSNILFSGMVLTGFVLRPGVGAPMVLAAVVGFLPARIEVVGPLQGYAEGAVYLAASGVSFLVVARLGRELDRLASSSRATHRARAGAFAAAERTRLHEWWDGLIHDRVLAALALAARGQSQDAVTPATEAVARLSGAGEAARVSPREAIERHARSLHVRLDLDLQGWSEEAAGDALEAAACEAITNVSRHAGTGHAWVTSRCDQGRCVVTVRDEGPGFDLEAVPEARLGVRRRILSTLAAVGGQAEIDSRPGEGTCVRLSAPIKVRPEDPPAPERWSLAMFTPIAVLAALHMGAHIAVGTTYLSAGVSPALIAFGMVAIPVLTVLAAVCDGRRLQMVLVALVITWGALIGNVVDPHIVDWRLWFVGAMDTAVVIIGLRRGLAAAFGVIAASCLLGVAILAIRGEVALVPLAIATFQVVMWGFGAGVFNLLLGRAERRIGAQESARAEATRRALALLAREEELAARRGALDAQVVPYLERIAAGEELDAQARARCAELESVARDQLLAGTLLTPELASSITQARSRGVVVTVTGRREAADEGLEAFHAVAAALLRAARPRDRVQLTWRAGAGGRRGVGSLVGLGAGDRWSLRLPRRVAGLDIDISLDEDAVLAELTTPDAARRAQVPVAA